MYIIAIAWLYVAGMIALTEPSLVAGLFSLVVYGFLPISLVLWLGNSKARRQRRQQDHLVADQGTEQGNRPPA